MDVRVVVGRDLARLRREQGPTQEATQAVTGVSQQYLSGLEGGTRNCTVVTLARIVDALGVEPADLLRLSQPPP